MAIPGNAKRFFAVICCLSAVANSLCGQFPAESFDLRPKSSDNLATAIVKLQNTPQPESEVGNTPAAESNVLEAASSTFTAGATSDATDETSKERQGREQIETTAVQREIKEKPVAVSNASQTLETAAFAASTARLADQSQERSTESVESNAATRDQLEKAAANAESAQQIQQQQAVSSESERQEVQLENQSNASGSSGVESQGNQASESSAGTTDAYAEANATVNIKEPLQWNTQSRNKQRGVHHTTIVIGHHNRIVSHSPTADRSAGFWRRKAAKLKMRKFAGNVQSSAALGQNLGIVENKVSKLTSAVLLQPAENVKEAISTLKVLPEATKLNLSEKANVTLGVPEQLPSVATSQSEAASAKSVTSDVAKNKMAVFSNSQIAGQSIRSEPENSSAPTIKVVETTRSLHDVPKLSSSVTEATTSKNEISLLERKSTEPTALLPNSVTVSTPANDNGKHEVFTEGKASIGPEYTLNREEAVPNVSKPPPVAEPARPQANSDPNGLTVAAASATTIATAATESSLPATAASLQVAQESVPASTAVTVDRADPNSLQSSVSNGSATILTQNNPSTPSMDESTIKTPQVIDHAELQPSITATEQLREETTKAVETQPLEIQQSQTIEAQTQQTLVAETPLNVPSKPQVIDKAQESVQVQTVQAGPPANTFVRHIPHQHGTTIFIHNSIHVTPSQIAAATLQSSGAQQIQPAAPEVTLPKPLPMPRSQAPEQQQSNGNSVQQDSTSKTIDQTIFRNISIPQHINPANPAAEVPLPTAIIPTATKAQAIDSTIATKAYEHSVESAKPSEPVVPQPPELPSGNRTDARVSAAISAKAPEIVQTEAVQTNPSISPAGAAVSATPQPLDSATPSDDASLIIQQQTKQSIATKLEPIALATTNIPSQEPPLGVSYSGSLDVGSKPLQGFADTKPTEIAAAKLTVVPALLKQTAVAPPPPPPPPPSPPPTSSLVRQAMVPLVPPMPGQLPTCVICRAALSNRRLSLISNAPIPAPQQPTIKVDSPKLESVIEPVTSKPPEPPAGQTLLSTIIPSGIIPQPGNPIMKAVSQSVQPAPTEIVALPTINSPGPAMPIRQLSDSNLSSQLSKRFFNAFAQASGTPGTPSQSAQGPQSLTSAQAKTVNQKTWSGGFSAMPNLNQQFGMQQRSVVVSSGSLPMSETSNRFLNTAPVKPSQSFQNLMPIASQSPLGQMTPPGTKAGDRFIPAQSSAQSVQMLRQGFPVGIPTPILGTFSARSGQSATAQLLSSPGPYSAQFGQSFAPGKQSSSMPLPVLQQQSWQPPPAGSKLSIAVPATQNTANRNSQLPREFAQQDTFKTMGRFLGLNSLGAGQAKSTTAWQMPQGGKWQQGQAPTGFAAATSPWPLKGTATFATSNGQGLSSSGNNPAPLASFPLGGSIAKVNQQSLMPKPIVQITRTDAKVASGLASLKPTGILGQREIAKPRAK